MNEDKRKAIFKSPARDQVDEFISWVKRRKRLTSSFVEKFGSVSLKQILDLANENLEDGRIRMYSYNRDEDAGRFFKIEFIENNS